MPDLVVYQHGDQEWWVTPLDEDLPLVRLNRMGASLLGAMDGRLSISALLEQFGKWVCGANQENRPLVSRTMVLTPVFVMLFRGGAAERAQRQREVGSPPPEGP